MAKIIMKIMCNINVANNESDNGYCGEWRCCVCGGMSRNMYLLIIIICNNNNMAVCLQDVCVCLQTVGTGVPTGRCIHGQSSVVSHGRSGFLSARW
jgi:hypothetical protein